MKLAKGFLEKIIPFINKGTYSNYFRDAEQFVEHMNYSLEHGFTSTWCLGGTYGSCWDDQLRTVSPEPEAELSQLDDFLMEAYPQTSFMQFRKINQCVDVSQHGDSDYYGGSTYHATKSLNFNSFSETLVELGLEQDSELIESEEFCKKWYEENLNTTTTNKKSKKIK